MTEKTEITEMNSKEIVYVALDIETLGCKFSHPVVAIGYCVGNQLGTKILEKGTICIEADLKNMEPRCYHEFWSKHPSILQEIEKEALPVQVAWQKFKDWLDSLETKYPNNTIVFLSDNPAFDIARLDYELFVRFDRMPLRYTSQGQYRCIQDPSERLAQIQNIRHTLNLDGQTQQTQHIQHNQDQLSESREQQKQQERIKQEPTLIIGRHWPENDAHLIYDMQIEAKRLMTWW